MNKILAASIFGDPKRIVYENQSRLFEAQTRFYNILTISTIFIASGIIIYLVIRMIENLRLKK